MTENGKTCPSPTAFSSFLPSYLVPSLRTNADGFRRRDTKAGNSVYVRRISVILGPEKIIKLLASHSSCFSFFFLFFFLVLFAFKEELYELIEDAEDGPKPEAHKETGEKITEKPEEKQKQSESE